MSSTSRLNPCRGEVWDVNFDPTIGSEIRKTRPAVIISSDAIGRLPIKLVAPITGWQPGFSMNIWHIRIDPDDTNGLSKTSTVDALQVRGIDVRRFIRKRGRLTATLMEEITAAIAAIIEHE